MYVILILTYARQRSQYDAVLKVDTLLFLFKKNPHLKVDTPDAERLEESRYGSGHD